MDGSSAVLNKSPWKRKEKKRRKILQQGVFVVGHPAKYQPRATGLNFVERTKHVAVLVVLPYRKSTLNAFLKFLRCEKVSKREKNL